MCYEVVHRVQAGLVLVGKHSVIAVDLAVDNDDGQPTQAGRKIHLAGSHQSDDDAIDVTGTHQADSVL